MLAQRLINPFRIVQVVLALVLCAAFGLSAFGAPSEDRRDTRNSDKPQKVHAGPRSLPGGDGHRVWTNPPANQVTNRPNWGNPAPVASPTVPVNQQKAQVDRAWSRDRRNDPAPVTTNPPPGQSNRPNWSDPRDRTPSSAPVNRPGWSGSRPDDTRTAPSYNPVTKDPGFGRGGDRDRVVSRPGIPYRPDQKPAPVYDRPATDKEKREAEELQRNRYSDVRPGSDRNDDHNYRPPVYNRPGDHRDGYDYRRIETRPADHYRSYSPPRWYTAPTYRSGYYYYPKHTSRYHYGYWVFGNYDPGFCRRSVYFHFGYLPYIQAARIFIGSYVAVSYYSRPVVIDDGYYLSRQGNAALDEALSDIREGWLDGRLDLVSRHVAAGEQIAVLLDGSYDYSLEADDYTEMTSDALDQVQTISFSWESVRERTDGLFTAYGRHLYRDSSGNTKTVYVSYTLRRIGGGYYITEVGSSARPLI